MNYNKEIEELREETKEEATNRISRELKAETKLKERRDIVMSYYFELTGTPMTEAQFQIYNECFNKAEAGYNIKSFIKEQGIKIDNDVLNSSFEEFKSKEGIV